MAETMSLSIETLRETGRQKDKQRHTQRQKKEKNVLQRERQVGGEPGDGEREKKRK